MGISPLKTSLIISGGVPITTLYISIASACILLSCIGTELCKSSSKFESLLLILSLSNVHVVY